MIPSPSKKTITVENVALFLWNDFVHNLSHLVNIKIPRCVVHSKPIVLFQLHGFADASTKAYTSCVYLRVVDNTVSSRLITSKSKLAPLKVISLPRLELCAIYG